MYRCAIVMTTNNITLTTNSMFTEVDMTNHNNLRESLTYLKTYTPYSCFISNTITIPLKQTNNQYRALTNFILPRSILDRDLTFYIFTNNSQSQSNYNMPNSNNTSVKKRTFLYHPHKPISISLKKNNFTFHP